MVYKDFDSIIEWWVYLSSSVGLSKIQAFCRALTFEKGGLQNKQGMRTLWYEIVFILCLFTKNPRKML